MFSHIVFDHDGTLVNTSKGKKELYFGIKELLISLSGHNAKLYVWTQRPRLSTVEILKSLDILHFFEDIYTSTDGEGKPYTSGLEYLVGKADKSTILVIGDSLLDILGANNFKVAGAGALWAFDDQESVSKDLLQAGAKSTWKSPKDLQQFLTKE